LARRFVPWNEIKFELLLLCLQQQLKQVISFADRFSQLKHWPVPLIPDRHDLDRDQQ